MDIYNPGEDTVQSTIDDAKGQIIFASTHDNQAISWLQNQSLHISLIEDIQSVDHSITYDEIDGSKLKIMKYLIADAQNHKLTQSYTVSILYFKNKLFILSQSLEVLNAIKQGYLEQFEMRQTTAYLLYLFPNIIIDNNTSIFDTIEAAFERLEDSIFQKTAQEDELHQDVYYIRRTLDKILKIATQEKSSIRKSYDHLLEDDKKALQYEYLDIKEHIHFLIDESVALLNRSEYLLNLHTGILSTRMNKVMQKLAAISLIFLPLTFIAGVYGMNFIHMPELSWKYGYTIVWALYLVVAVVIFSKLKKSKWL